jgi:hypothetical protein
MHLAARGEAGSALAPMCRETDRPSFGDDRFSTRIEEEMT